MLRSGDLGGGTGRKEQYLLSIIAPDGSKCPQTMKQNAAETVKKEEVVTSVPSTPPEMLIIFKRENKQINNT